MTRSFTWSIVASLFFVANAYSQGDYTHGHGALQIFDQEGMQNTPQWVIYWIYFMALSFFCGLLFVKNHVVARWVVGCFVAGITVSQALILGLGIVPLSGFIALVHLIAWTPALIKLLLERAWTRGMSAYAVWSAVMTGVILFSFVFDVRDAFIYLRHL